MTKTCYFVVGPESSGNRLMAKILVDAGCYGDANMFQRLDRHIPTDVEKIVWIRSFPHGARGEGRHWPDMTLLRKKVRDLGYVPQAVVMARDEFCMARSQLKAGHVSDMHEAMYNIMHAKERIYTELNKASIAHITITFEGLIYRARQTTTWLLNMLNLPDRGQSAYIYDANSKWYKELENG